MKQIFSYLGKLFRCLQKNKKKQFSKSRKLKLKIKKWQQLKESQAKIMPDKLKFSFDI